LISLQWYALVLTLGLAVYMLFRKARSNLGKNFFASPKICTPVHLCVKQCQWLVTK